MLIRYTNLSLISLLTYKCTFVQSDISANDIASVGLNTVAVN